jgi:hypothetical protein
MLKAINASSVFVDITRESLSPTIYICYRANIMLKVMTHTEISDSY